MKHIKTLSQSRVRMATQHNTVTVSGPFHLALLLLLLVEKKESPEEDNNNSE